MASVIQLILDAKNNVSPALKQIQTDLKKVDSGISSLNKIATLDLGLTGLQAALSTIQQIGQAVADVSQAGAGFERLSTNFSDLAAQYGTSGRSIVEAIDGVTQGTLSLQTMMQQADNAMLLGVADTAEEFETLAKIAVDRGRAMGISMEYAFESIVKGVGRLSPLILDNLGIVLDADKTYADFARTIGKVADDLTDAEKRAALISRLKEEVSDFDSSAVLDAAGSWEKFAASVTNATAALGDFMNNSGAVGDTLVFWAQQLDILSATMSDDEFIQMKGVQAQLDMAIGKVEEFRLKILELNAIKADDDNLQRFFVNTDNAEANLAYYTQLVEDLTNKIRLLGVESAAASRDSDDLGSYKKSSALAELDRQYAQVSDTIINWYAKALDISKTEAEANINSVIALKGSWAAAAPVIAQLGNEAVIAGQKFAQATAIMNSMIGGAQSAALSAYVDSGYNPQILESFQAVEAELTALQPQLEEMDATSAAFFGRMMQEEASAPFKAISEATNEMNKNIGAAVPKTKRLTQEFQDLRSIVQGLWDEATQDIGGADLAEFLPHVDQPAEAARRIASVMVEGFDSEWVDYFKTTFPDLFSQYMGAAGGDIQAASAMLLKDFQDGLRPELIDKDKIKELAKRIFGADANMKKLVDEIATDLAKELGISMEEAQELAGGAAGVKKKPLSKEEVDKLLKGFDFAPKWDMSESRKKMIDAGKASGLLDEEGKMLVPVSLDFGEGSTGDIIKGGFKVELSGFTFEDKDAFVKNLKDAISTPLVISPQLPSDFATTFKTNVLDKIQNSIAMAVVPAAADLTTWDNFITGLEGAVGQVALSINPTISTETFETTFAPIRTALSEGFIDQATLDAMTFTLAAGLGIAIYNNETMFSDQGSTIGTLMTGAFEEMNVGQLIANTLSTQLTQAQRTFEISAASSAKTWGTYFLKTVSSTVPIELIHILTDLVTPEVQAKLNGEKERGEGDK